MRIYKVTSDFKKYDVCGINIKRCRKAFNLKHLYDWDVYFSLDGTSQAINWWPRVMERLYGGKRKLGDYIDDLRGGTIILENAAIEKLKPVMGNIEILPLKCDFGDYWAINVMDVRECIDYKKSEFTLLSDDLIEGRPRIMYFSKYWFIKEQIEGFNVFKIIDEPKSAVFVSDIFVESVKKHRVTGFVFELVWDSQGVAELSPSRFC